MRKALGWLRVFNEWSRGSGEWRLTGNDGARKAMIDSICAQSYIVRRVVLTPLSANWFVLPPIAIALGISRFQSCPDSNG
jgi:hypothetical protein